MKNFAMSLVVVLSVLFVLANVGESAMPCNSVVSKAAACAGFAMGRAPRPTPQSPCCNNLRQLAASVRGPADKKAVCECLINGVRGFRGVQDSFLSQLPGICGINVGFPVSTKVNCNSIH